MNGNGLFPLVAEQELALGSDGDKVVVRQRSDTVEDGTQALGNLVLSGFALGHLV